MVQGMSTPIYRVRTLCASGHAHSVLQGAHSCRVWEASVNGGQANGDEETEAHARQVEHSLCQHKPDGEEEVGGGQEGEGEEREGEEGQAARTGAGREGEVGVVGGVAVGVWCLLVWPGSEGSATEPCGG